jgi:hypothetical protein
MRFKIQKALNAAQRYFPTFWALPICRTVQSENRNLHNNPASSGNFTTTRRAQFLAKIKIKLGAN